MATGQACYPPRSTAYPRRQAVAVSSGSSSSSRVRLPANFHGITSRRETGDVGSRLLGAAAWVRAQVNPNGFGGCLDEFP
jgi:hypothetical protein